MHKVSYNRFFFFTSCEQRMKIVFYDMKIQFWTNNCPSVYLVQAMNDQYLIIEVIGNGLVNLIYQRRVVRTKLYIYKFIIKCAVVVVMIVW
jgi:hypothetical protein